MLLNSFWLLSGLRNRPFDIFSVEWHLTDLPMMNMDLIIMKNHDKTKNAS